MQYPQNLNCRNNLFLQYDGDLDQVLAATANDVRIHVQTRFQKVLKGFQARITGEAALREVRIALGLQH